MKKSLIGFVTLLFVMTHAVAGEYMLRIEMNVQEGEGDPTTISMSLPAGLLHSFAPQVQEVLNDVDLEEQELNLRQIWQEIRDAGPNNFVEVKGQDGNVLVSTDATHLKVDVDTRDEGEIKLRIPLELGDLFFNNDLQNLNVDEIISRLGDLVGEDLVTITGDKINGRVWVE